MPLGLHIPLSDILANDTGGSESDTREIQGIKIFDFTLTLYQVLKVMKRLNVSKESLCWCGPDLKEINSKMKLPGYRIRTRD